MPIDIAYKPINGPRITIGTYPTLDAAFDALDAAKDGPYYSVVEDDGGCLDHCRLGWSRVREYADSWEGRPALNRRYWPGNDGRDRSRDPVVLTQCTGWPFVFYWRELGVGMCLREGSDLHKRIVAAVTAHKVVV